MSQLSLGPNCWGFSIPPGFPQDTPTPAFESPWEPGSGLEAPVLSVSMTGWLLAQAHQNTVPWALGPGWGGKATDGAEGLRRMERGTCPSPASHTSLIGVRGSEPPNRLCQGEDCINSPKSQDPRTALLNTVQQPQCSQGRCMDSWARGRVSTYQSLLQSVALRAATSRPGCRSPQPKAVRPGSPALSTGPVLGGQAPTQISPLQFVGGLRSTWYTPFRASVSLPGILSP